MSLRLMFRMGLVVVLALGLMLSSSASSSETVSAHGGDTSLGHACAESTALFLNIVLTPGVIPGGDFDCTVLGPGWFNYDTGDISRVAGAAGSGITGGAASGEATLNTDPNVLQRRVTGACPGGQAIRVVASTGAVTCQIVGGIGGAGTANRIAMFTGAATIGNSAIAQSAGNIGIGTTTPNEKLTVLQTGLAEAGHFEVDNAGSPSPALFVTKNGGVGRALSVDGDVAFSGSENNGTTAALQVFASSGTARLLLDANEIDTFPSARSLSLNSNTTGPVILATGGGDVGIGTASPDARLHVDGGTDCELVALNGYIMTNAVSSTNICIDSNEIMARNNGVASTLFLQVDGGNVGIGTGSTNDALDVVGDIDATGCIQTDNSGSIGGTCVSDMRLKKNIQQLSNSLEKITRLTPVTFEWREGYYDISHERGTGVGLIAQELEQVFPHLVTTDDNGYKRVRYDIELQMHMLQAIKEQQLQAQEKDIQIEVFQQQIANLEARLAALEAR